MCALTIPVFAACTSLPPDPTITSASVETFNPWTGDGDLVTVTDAEDLAELAEILDMPENSIDSMCMDAVAVTITFERSDGSDGEEWTQMCNFPGRLGALADWGAEMVEDES